MKVTNKATVRVGAAGVAVIGIIVLFLVMFAVERIDSGHTIFRISIINNRS